jgi:beta-galactosidase
MNWSGFPVVSAAAVALCIASGAATAGPRAEGTAIVAPPEASAPRERTSLDAGWRFALGHAQDPSRDFGHGTVPFFFAKAGHGDGPAGPKFDDRAWRQVEVPHDWGVEVPFSPKADANHGSRAIGPGFPENNIGWYRKSLTIPESDRGRRIAVEFDGIFRNAVVWFNGHYLGREHSGYSSSRFDLTDYVNYDGSNTLVVRVDTSTFEGWFYEGAGLYRHVWLTKTDPLHIPQWGTYVTTVLQDRDARVTARATIRNEDVRARRFTVEQEVFGPDGRRLAETQGAVQQIASGASVEHTAELALKGARLWSLETPVLHKLVTTVRENGQVCDRYETTFGVRQIRWDANTGFWLNGRNIKLKGTNNHQDHAGIGVALPDAMQAYRLERLKAMGSNAYRTSHNPPTPELLEAADRLGMLVIDEHRMMGTAPEIAGQLERLVVRDRNHPSVVLWSVGNEEWGIEGREIGARLSERMQAQVRALDPTRPVTTATAGNDGRGISTTTEVASFNYRTQHDADAYHRQYPDTPIVMSEEGSTFATRGVYFDDRENAHLAAYDKPQRPITYSSIQQGWQAVAERPWMAGMFVWTGFDYRGETTPFGWPAIGSQFGMLDTTGLFKDSAWYLKSQWTEAPMAHIVGHWNWPDRMGQPVPIWIYANADEAELLLNGRSLGRQRMLSFGHLEWQVPYAPGVLTARAYRNGKLVASDRVETTQAPRTLKLSVERPGLPGSERNIAVVTVSAVDAKGRTVPLAADKVTFALAGSGRILGVGNGDPSSHEPDQFLDQVAVDSVIGWEMADLDAGNAASRLPSLASLQWRDPFRWYPSGTGPATPPAFVLRARWEPSAKGEATTRTLFLPRLSPGQRVFVGGMDVTATIAPNGSGVAAALPTSVVQKPGAQDIVILVPEGGEEALSTLQEVGVNGNNVAYDQSVSRAEPWSRSLFNGYAQVIVRLGSKNTRPDRLVVTASRLSRASVNLERMR